ncbi:MAG: hypothetical protein PSV36_14930 [Algoriphagus sp.]|nr:hypothetical protein [Algoriphagus sp.]
MSQFDFPRINFHGSVLLDVATANNGRFDPLRVYDQVKAAPVLPPRVYITDDQLGEVKTMGYSVTPDGDQNYVEISPINTTEIYDQWAQVTLGTFKPDASYKRLYDFIPLTGTSTPLSSNWITPGYWNYFGDLSIFAEDIRITGVQLPDGAGGVETWTPDNSSGCPQGLAQLLGTSLSFHQDFFDPNSRTSAMFCDVDSIGQTCTQIFYGKAGIYSKESNQTFFAGKPCKSTFNWMSLCKVLNWYAGLLMPMSGSAYFYSTIDLTNGSCDPALQQVLNQYAGTNVTSLSMKIMLHQVYEVHNPDYSVMPTQPLGNNNTSVRKNPARAVFSGSITPCLSGDMTTNTISRILKNPLSASPTIDIQPFISQNLVPVPVGSNTPVSLITSAQLPPAFLKVNPVKSLISLDVINTICEFGTGLGEYSPYGGDTSIPPFTGFENYDFGQLSLYFSPDNGSTPILIGSIDFANDYNMSTFLARGGVMDFPMPSNINWAEGTFQLKSGGSNLMVEDDFLILSDQQGSYAEQNQAPGYGYKSDGSGRGPVFLRVLYRGQPVPQSNPVLGVYQYVDPSSGNPVNTPINFYDGMMFNYPVDKAGCMQYVFAITPQQQIPVNASPAQSFYFSANSYSITSRVLADFPNLAPYLNGTLPITWQVIMDNVLSNFETVLPIMYAIIPFKEENWSDPVTLQRLLLLTDEKSWGGYMFMPVTREISAPQRALLQKWAKQKLYPSS